jgi:predicted dehydrogenase
VQQDIRWGILATGKIAHSFARDLALVPGATLAAVGSRSDASARAFAAEHGAPVAHGSYVELAADPDVDVVYIASPHALHLEHARLVLEAGKHVLCEKPLTLNVAEA